MQLNHLISSTPFKFLVLLFFLANTSLCVAQDYRLAQEQDFALADPIVKFESNLFQDSTWLKAGISYPDAVIRYTMDGSEPQADSPILVDSLILSKSSTLKMQAFHAACQPSSMLEFPFIKIDEKLAFKKANLTTPPSSKYPGKGAEALFDLKKGSLNFREAAWMGFEGQDMELTLEFSKAQKISKITTSILHDHASWIFAPFAVVIFSSKDGKKYENVGSEYFPVPLQEEKAALEFLEIKINSIQTKHLKILLKVVPAIPAWHAGKGNRAWLFVDEIIIE